MELVPALLEYGVLGLMAAIFIVLYVRKDTAYRQLSAQRVKDAEKFLTTVMDLHEKHERRLAMLQDIVEALEERTPHK